MTATLQPHLDSVVSSSTSIAALPFNTIPTHFIHSLLHQSGVDNLIRDPHPHERGLFTVKPAQQKENIPLTEDDSRVLRTRTEKTGISPLLMAKYSAGGNVEADVFLHSAAKLLEIYPVAGAKERIQRMLGRHAELTEEVLRLESLVEKQGRELEAMNNSRMGMYDDEYGAEEAVTQRILDDEDEQVKSLEDKIKEMQEQISRLDGRITSM